MQKESQVNLDSFSVLAERKGGFIRKRRAMADPGVLISLNAKRTTFRLSILAEREGFEPPVPLSTSVFKTGAIDHSATSPKVYALRDSNPGPID